MVITTGIGRDDSRFGDKERTRYAAPLRIVFLQKRNNRHMVRPSGFVAGQRCKDDSMAEGDVANLGGLE